MQKEFFWVNFSKFWAFKSNRLLRSLTREVHPCQSLKAKTTTIATGVKLDANEKGNNVDKKQYPWMVGLLLYLIASQSDMLFSVFKEIQKSHIYSY